MTEITDQHEMIKTQRAKFEERVRGLRCYIKELTDMAAALGTDEALIEEDLTKARADLEFYERQAEDCAEALDNHPVARRIFQVYKDSAAEWRWRLVAGNDQIIAESGEGYHKQQDCLHGIELVKDSKDARVEIGE